MNNSEIFMSLCCFAPSAGSAFHALITGHLFPISVHFANCSSGSFLAFRYILKPLLSCPVKLLLKVDWFD